VTTEGAIVEMAAATHRGLMRSENEDCVAARPETGLAVLADGMGGHNAGEVASRIAVEVISGAMAASLEAESRRPTAERIESMITDAIARANTLVYNAARGHSAYSGMGTTIVVAVWYGAHVSIGHIGDSRAYRLRAGELVQLTRDHTLVQDRVERGTLSRAQARRAAARNILTRALGTAPSVAADLRTYDAQSEDVYVLCSDGLSDMLDDRDIRSTLTLPHATLREAADQLVLEANHRGGADNISVIVVKPVDAAEPPS
jgi:PPM family protein phosphatase